MSLTDHYRVLGLRSGATFEEVKAAYRRLARRYHPDINPGDQKAKDKFIQVTQAYQQLATVLAPERLSGQEVAQAIASSEEQATPPVSSEPTPSIPRSPAPSQPVPVPRVQINAHLSPEEQDLKQRFYQQLQLLFQAQRFPRAIALVEGLAARLPMDLEVRQWQAITYQRWGRHLIHQNQIEKGKRYLKKALRTDPHNKSLWQEVHQDLATLKQTPPPSGNA